MSCRRLNTAGHHDTIALECVAVPRVRHHWQNGVIFIVDLHTGLIIGGKRYLYSLRELSLNRERTYLRYGM